MACVTPAVIASRLCDLLQSFPGAAISGIRWRVLAKKYEERHGARLDLASLGHSSALSAATTLLWDVLRVVDAKDVDNPLVGLEDELALIPRPGFLATWPSLYQTFADIAQDANSSTEAQALLLSQLKPLLLKHWHAKFDEGAMVYFNDDGSAVKLKKMKHLVQAVLRWREDRVAWVSSTPSRRSSRAGSVDSATQAQLELVPSSRHNDLLLRCAQAPDSDATTTCEVSDSSASTCSSSRDEPRGKLREQHVSAIDTEEDASRAAPDFMPDIQQRAWMEEEDASRAAPDFMPDIQQRVWMEELAALRAENDRLRSRNQLLELFSTPIKAPICLLDSESIDDPFEPPPERLCDWQTATPGSETPRSEASSGWLPSAHSGSATPLGHAAPFSPTGFNNAFGQACALVPMLFALGDHMRIPEGPVQQARAFWKRSDQGVLPSFFAQK